MFNNFLILSTILCIWSFQQLLLIKVLWVIFLILINFFCLKLDYEVFGYLFIFTSAGTFKLTLQFTEDYPNKPPTVRFISRMFHPNSKSYV